MMRMVMAMAMAMAMAMGIGRKQGVIVEIWDSMAGSTTSQRDIQYGGCL